MKKVNGTVTYTDKRISLNKSMNHINRNINNFNNLNNNNNILKTN